jgi:hypothetical protein
MLQSSIDGSTNQSLGVFRNPEQNICLLQNNENSAPAVYIVHNQKKKKHYINTGSTQLTEISIMKFC